MTDVAKYENTKSNSFALMPKGAQNEDTLSKITSTLSIKVFAIYGTYCKYA